MLLQSILNRSFQPGINLKDEEISLDGTAFKYESILSNFFQFC